jgi:Protein of unknown function (DUF4199)
MTDHSQTSRYAIGLRFGLITGFIYIVLLFLRYHYISSNPVQFGLSALVSYIIILMMYLFAGIARKKELGGYGELKDIFQSIFIVILITELFYIIFNLIYLKYIDPAFWENLKKTSISYYENLKLSNDDIAQRIKDFKDVDQETKPSGLLRGYGYSIVIDSLFGLIIASILKKKRLSSTEILDNPKR